jgi:hypothetical protein
LLVNKKCIIHVYTLPFLVSYLDNIVLTIYRRTM